ncbi:MAG: hypothetical protein ACR2Q3_05675 [Woeseiaceae bacterium]
MNCSLTVVWTVVAVLAFLLISSGAHAQGLFDSHETLQVTIEGPLTTLQKERSDEDYLDGQFSYTDEVGEVQSFDLKIRARGRYRRQKKTCSFPPVRLNFRTGQVEGSLLDGQDKLKLVTHCKSRDSHQQYVLREYLAYRILQTLTEKSFSARLLKITYVDSESDKDPINKYGFVIEDADDIGKRISLKEMDVKALSYNDLDAGFTNLINIYQYLIGNTDFSLIRGPDDDNCCHNSVPFSAGGEITSIPYDLDFSGLVNAPYAEPHPRFKLRSVLVRKYRGQCSNNERLPETLSFIQSKRAEIYGLVDDLADLDKRSRKQVIGYLDSFFKDVSDEKTVQKKLIKGCS